jgi:hypothetical protein
MLLTGSDSLRPWGARSVDRARALLAQVEALSVPQQIKPATQFNKQLTQKISQQVLAIIIND